MRQSAWYRAHGHPWPQTRCAVVNLGFSGNGKMDAAVGDFLVRVDALAYVIDCLPNMQAAEVTSKCGPLVLQLRRAQPTTPIVLVEDRRFTNDWILPSQRMHHTEKHRALRAIYDKLIADGVKNLFYIEGIISTATIRKVRPTRPCQRPWLHAASGGVRTGLAKSTWSQVTFIQAPLRSICNERYVPLSFCFSQHLAIVASDHDPHRYAGDRLRCGFAQNPISIRSPIERTSLPLCGSFMIAPVDKEKPTILGTPLDTTVGNRSSHRARNLTLRLNQLTTIRANKGTLLLR